MKEKKISTNGKGSKPRPFTNYSGYLEQMDKIFGYNPLEFDGEDLFKYTNACSHTITNQTMLCKFCGRSISEIHTLGEAYMMEN